MSAAAVQASSADDYPFVRELANNATAVAALLALRTPDEHGMCHTCTRPGTGYRHTPWPCPVASLALLARDIRARVTGRKLIVVNGARLKTGDGSFGHIIDQDVSQGPVTITIEESEYFDSKGCADWVKAD